MKNQLVFTVIIVLAESSLIAAGFAFAQAITAQSMSNPVIIATPTPTPIPTSPPTPTSSPTPIPNVSLDYDEVDQTTQNNETTVTLHVKVTYNFGDTTTYDYQNFVLDIRTSRGGLEPFPIYLLTGHAKPLETGSVTVGSNNRNADFTLSFRFPTIQNSFGGPIHFAYYELVYNSNAVSTSTPKSTALPAPTQVPSPTVPELSWLAIVPLLLSLFSVAVLMRHRKTAKLKQ